MNVYETVVCGRCGGTGEYSFNMLDGTRCYGCGGTGAKLTKRGREAKRYSEELRTIKVRDLQVGHRIRNNLTRKYATIKSLQRGIAKEIGGMYRLPGTHEVVIAQTTRGEFYMEADHSVLLGFTDRAEMEAHYARVEEYQASLTKAGTPRKRRKTT